MWGNAQRSYYSLDKLIKYVNAEQGEMFLRYSTVNDYLDAMKEHRELFTIEKT